MTIAEASPPSPHSNIDNEIEWLYFGNEWTFEPRPPSAWDGWPGTAEMHADRPKSAAKWWLRTAGYLASTHPNGPGRDYAVEQLQQAADDAELDEAWVASVLAAWEPRDYWGASEAGRRAKEEQRRRAAEVEARGWVQRWGVTFESPERREAWISNHAEIGCVGSLPDGPRPEDEEDDEPEDGDVDEETGKVYDFPPRTDPPRAGTTSAAMIPMRRARWTWAGRMPAGALTLLAGREGIGKSTVWAWLAAQLTRGALDGEHYRQPRDVLVAATEDDWSYTIVPRLVAAGADLSRVHRIDKPGTFPAGIAELLAAIRAHRVALVVLDPLMSRLDGALDSHKDAEVRQALEPLVRAAETTGVALLGLIYVNKSNSGDPLTTIMGSRAFAAVARSVLYAVQDGEDEDLRHLAHAKCNLGPLCGTLPYRTHGRVVGEDDGPIVAPVIGWGEEHDQGARDLLAATAGDPETRNATTEAAEWLSDYLTSKGGEAPSADAKKAGRVAGHSERALQRALSKAGVTASSAGYPRETTWTLDPSRAKLTRPQSRQQSRQPPGET